MAHTAREPRMMDLVIGRDNHKVFPELAQEAQYRRDVLLHVASALVYVSPLIQDKNRASLHDIRTDLGERSNFSPLLLEAPLGGTLDRGRGASGSGAARPPRQCV